jgi:ribosomal protein S18 acetylase RimI-like enzyme
MLSLSYDQVFWYNLLKSQLFKKILNLILSSVVEVKIGMALRYEYSPKLIPQQIADLRLSVGWDGRVEKYKKKLGKSYLWVACFDNKSLVGYADVVSDGVDDAYIRDVIVHPDYQHRSIGTKLLEMITTRMKLDGIKMVHVIFDPSLETFYRQAHFTIMLSGVIDNEK